MLVPWTTLRFSPSAKRWRRVGIVIGVTASVAILCAAVATPAVNAGLVALGLTVAAGCSWAASMRAAPVFEIGVSQASEIVIRRGSGHESESVDATGAGESVPGQVIFAAPWLISLRSGSTLIPIWPDSLPPTLFRRLWVHLHWGRAAANKDDRNPTTQWSGDAMER